MAITKNDWASEMKLFVQRVKRYVNAPQYMDDNKRKEYLKNILAFGIDFDKYFKKSIISRRYKVGKDNITECYCTNCGRTYQINHSDTCENDGYECPDCGNKEFYTHYSNKNQQTIMYVEPFGEDGEFLCCKISLKNELSTYACNNDELKNYKNSSYTACQAFAMFSKKFGIVPFSDCSDKFYTRNNYNYNIKLITDKNLIVSNKAGEGKDWEKIISDAIEINKEINTKWLEKKNNSNKVTKKKEPDAYHRPTSQATIDKILNNLHDACADVYSSNPTNPQRGFFCEKCHQFEIINIGEIPDDYTYVCKNCGNEVPAERIHTNYSGALYYTHRCLVIEKADDNSNGLVFRYILIKQRIDSVNKTYDYDFEEERRIYFHQNQLLSYEKHSAKTFAKSYFRSYSYLNSPDYQRADVIPNSDEELIEIINDSVFKHSGLIEAWNLDKNSNYNKLEDVGNTYYLSHYVDNNNLEKIVKSNVSHLLKESNAIGCFCSNSKSLTEILEIPKRFIKEIATQKYKYNDYSNIKKLYEADKNVSIEDYEMIRHIMDEEIAENEARAALGLSSKRYFNIDVVRIAKISKNYGISYKRIVEYLSHVFMHQCIHKDEALQLWSDYLKMATDLHYDISDKSRLFPASLKKEHDVATFAYQTYNVTFYRENFIKQAQENKKYEYEDKDYIVIVPKTVEDVIEEATRQQNCLKTYVTSIANGHTSVAFVRKKDDPDKSYITAEIRDGRVVQFLKKNNNRPTKEEDYIFLKKWCKATGISSPYVR